MKFKQTTERRISAAVRIALVALLCLANIALLLVLGFFLQTHAAYIYLLLELVGLILVLRIQSQAGSPTYKLAWTIVILAMPAAGLIMYLLWGGNTQRRRHIAANVPPPPPHKDYEQSRSSDYLGRMEDGFPTWVRTARHLVKHDFMLYKNTQATYFPDGEGFFADLITRLEKAEHFIFLE